MMTLRGETVLVTGANGFVGGALVARLLNEGVRVRGMVRAEAKGAHIAALGAEVVVGDLTDGDSLRRAVEGCAVVFHVAAVLSGPEAVQYATNVTGTVNLAEAAHEAGVRRLVHVSTIAAYGYRPPDVVTEDTPLRPRRDNYGQSKALGERRLWQRAAELGLDVTVVRPGMVYGPRSDLWTRAMFNLVKRPPAFLPGGGVTNCPAIYIDDVVDLMVILAEHPRAVGEVFNVVSDPPPTWRDFWGAYAAMAGHQSFVSIPVLVLRVAAMLVEPLLRLRGETQPARDVAAGMF